jgi:hypothetical protein
MRVCLKACALSRGSLIIRVFQPPEKLKNILFDKIFGRNDEENTVGHGAAGVGGLSPS